VEPGADARWSSKELARTAAAAGARPRATPGADNGTSTCSNGFVAAASSSRRFSWKRASRPFDEKRKSR